MAVDQAPTEKGKKAARGLQESAKAEERKVEAKKGGGLKKGSERFNERAESSDGKDAGQKQK